MNNCNECKETNSFICGKNKCNIICCPSCIIKHYLSCSYKVKFPPKIVSKEIEEDESDRGHPFYKI